MGDLYEILGVNKSATTQEIKTAYQKLALKYHPDKQDSLNAEEACSLFAKISQAWHILSNTELRNEYDSKRIASTSQLPINEEVYISDMTLNRELDAYTRPCRCGGEYIIPKTEIETDEDCVIFCDTCSLCIKLLPSMQPADNLL